MGVFDIIEAVAFYVWHLKYFGKKIVFEGGAYSQSRHDAYVAAAAREAAKRS